MDIKGKTALVLASSQGFGFAIAKTFKEAGAAIILQSRGGARLKDAAASLGCHYSAWDLGDENATAKNICYLQDHYGPIDIIVTNCGGPKMGGILDLTATDWRVGAQSIFMSVIEAVNATAPLMQKRGNGRIILNLSVTAKEPIPNLALSNVYRSALLAMTKTLSFELASSGTTVNAILPGYINTDRLAAFKGQVGNLKKSIPMGDFGRPKDLAQLALFLASDAGQYITGQAITCDGGLTKSI